MAELSGGLCKTGSIVGVVGKIRCQSREEKRWKGAGLLSVRQHRGRKSSGKREGAGVRFKVGLVERKRERILMNNDF